MSQVDDDNDVYVMNADGTGRLNLTHHPGTDAFARWSPDGQRIAFASRRDGGQFEVFVMDADGANVKRLTSGAKE